MNRNSFTYRAVRIFSLQLCGEKDHGRITIRPLFSRSLAVIGLIIVIWPGVWLAQVQVQEQRLSRGTLHGYYSETPYTDETRKRCVIDSRLSHHVLAVGDEATLEVWARNDGCYQGDRVEMAPNPYYGAPPPPTPEPGSRGGSKGYAYDHAREFIEHPTEVNDKVSLDCTASLAAPGFDHRPMEPRLTTIVPYGESRKLGQWEIEAIVPGHKRVAVHTPDPNRSNRYQVEVRHRHLGLPLWAEEWAAIAAVFLGSSNTLPWWLEWRRRRKANNTGPRGRPVVERLRGRGRR